MLSSAIPYSLENEALRRLATPVFGVLDMPAEPEGSNFKERIRHLAYPVREQGGLVWVYDPGRGCRVYRPASGRLLATLSAGSGHWNSPVVTDGRVALPEGNANDHATSGVLDIWHVRKVQKVG